MKLGLIAMSGLRVENPELKKLGLTLPGFVERREVIASLPSLALLTLAGQTAPDIELKYIELNDFCESLSIPEEFDAVAISSFTAQINSAYCLADKYRALGTKVILGGLHVTALPHEAILHADAVLLGEGEILWEELINDLIIGELKQIYDARNMEFDLKESPIPRYELLDIEKYNRLTVQTQRGCPFKCEFCASSIQLTRKYKTKPIKNIINEIERIKSLWSKPFIELADDNTFANKSHAKKLARALSTQDIKWFTETDISVAEDDELLSILSDSGCRQLLIGFESPSPQALHKIELKTNWKEKQLDKYKEAIYRIQRRGISVNGCFILGLDGQDTSIFNETYQFVNDSDLSEVQITIQTPFPGTDLYRRLQDSNRLLQNEFWDKCTLFDVNFIPEKMSIGELESGFLKLMKDLYSDSLVKKRKEQFIKQARSFRKTSCLLP
ncbi:MAG: B12-binding domain-containing radical SAM protein [Arenicella sp.]